MNDDAPRRPATRLVEGGRRREWTNGVVNPPVWRASTMLFDDVATLRAAGRKPDEGFYYGRRGTPTQWALADALTSLEPGAAGTVLLPSGVAAITTTLLALLAPGDELLVVDSAYEPTRVFADTILARIGVTTRYYDPLVSGDAIGALFSDATKVILMESPGSLTFEVQDVPAIAAAARARGIVSVIDNTWATPLLFPAIGHGVDVSILACTKYVVGHSDVMMGSVTAVPGLFERIRKTAQGLGQCVSPDDAFLASRGLRTMGVRLRQHGESALAIARWLAAHPRVARVLHPALPDALGHDRWQRDFAGASGLFAIALRGDDAMRVQFVDALHHFGIGFSWGGYESLALPIEPERARTAVPWPSPGPMVRLQIGLEDTDDLIADLAQALDRAG
ncbi:cystathionine beta-lyase [Sphingomonas nostoxanthinifaciens]|uniref:cystathionine beta-lyase n=1 Tax=Sphingomonas nostoxanthinifaciens TaxID=2872652 RepID=UPI001CC1DF49|nr:cystathionine beta-lyase [Sphingomonas nostoxanthinifaciens]UAK24001.1 cystathionine beta-lyase [Sphingomonas nostoxanthinifaciens]